MAQPESRLSREIMKLIRARGGFVWKNHGGSTMMAGLPDITGVYHGVMIGIETKMPEGSGPTPIQRHRHAQIIEAGGYVTVARSVRHVATWLDRLPVPTAENPSAAI